MRAAFATALAGPCLIAGCAPQRPAPQHAMIVSVSTGTSVDGPCTVEVDGERIPLDAFFDFAQRWPGREAHLNGGIDTPYRCVGRIIYDLQRANFQIGFIAEPAPATPEASQ
jgi:hypothetical protein